MDDECYDPATMRKEKWNNVDNIHRLPTFSHLSRALCFFISTGKIKMDNVSYDPATMRKGKWNIVCEDAHIQPHVLVVDDEGIFRIVHEAMFKKHSCKVHVACNGLQALAYLGLADDTEGMGIEPIAKVSLVCSDYYMPPGMTGYELLKKIKESATTRNVPIVIVSSNVVLGQVTECMEAGATMFVAKSLKSADVEHFAKLIKDPFR